mgnify:CR=1 FL=1
MKNRKEYKGNYGVRLDILAFSANSKKASLTPLVTLTPLVPRALKTRKQRHNQPVAHGLEAGEPGTPLGDK